MANTDYISDTQERRVRGTDAVLKLSGSHEISVSNVSWDREVNTDEIQLNDSLKPTITTTGLRFSGSFEYEGTNNKLQTAIFSDGTATAERGEPNRFGTLVYKENYADGTSRKFTFRRVMITSMSRDAPSDGIVSASFDFVAEDLVGPGNE